MGFSWARYQTHVPCTGRQIPNHWAIREVPCDILKQVVTPMKNKQEGGNLFENLQQKRKKRE